MAITTGSDNITIRGGVVDEGAWHRAVQIGQWLFDKTMWDGRTHLTICDPYKVHGKIFTQPFRWPKKGEDYVIDQLRDGVYVPVEIEGMEEPEAGVPIPPRDEIDPVTGEVTPVVFDYNALDMETRIVVQQKTEQIKLIGRRLSQDIVTIGEHIIAVKDKLGYGKFDAWLSVEFGWTRRTAERFMSVAERFEKRHNVAFSPTVLYLLAQPSTPDEAIEDLQERQESGEPVTVAVAKAVVDTAKLDEAVKTDVQADAAKILTFFAGQTIKRSQIGHAFQGFEAGRLQKAINFLIADKSAALLAGNQVRFKATTPPPAPSPASGEGRGDRVLDVARQVYRLPSGGRVEVAGPYPDGMFGVQFIMSLDDVSGGLPKTATGHAFARLKAFALARKEWERRYSPKTVNTRDRDPIDDEPSAHESGWMVPIDEEVLEPPTITDPVLAIPGMDGLMGTLDELRAGEDVSPAVVEGHAEAGEVVIVPEETALEQLIRAMVLIKDIDTEAVIAAMREMKTSDRHQLRQDVYDTRGVLGTLTASIFTAFKDR